MFYSSKHTVWSDSILFVLYFVVLFYVFLILFIQIYSRCINAHICANTST